MKRKENIKVKNKTVWITNLKECYDKYHVLSIPFYQRIYSWEENNYKMLLNNLKDFEGESYFIGFIIVKKLKQSLYVQIIDGQNRLITLSLLLKAIFELCSQHNPSFRFEEYDYDKNITRIVNYLKADVGKIEINKTIFDCYKNIKEWLLEQINSKQDFIGFLINKIWNTSFVLMELTQNTDDITVYETINSTGKSLTSEELMKNYLLFSAKNDNDEQTVYIKWEDIKKSTKSHFDDFIYRYLIMKVKKYLKKDGLILYKYFKDLIDKSINVVSFMKGLEKYAKIYWKFIKIEDDPEFKGILSNPYFKHIEKIETMLPLLIEVYSKICIWHKNKPVLPKEVEKSFKNFFNLISLRLKRGFIIEDLKNLNREIGIYLNSDELDIDTLDSNNIDNRYAKFKKFLNKEYIPNDYQIKQYLSSTRLKNSRAKMLLFNIENYKRITIQNDYKLPNHKDFSVEHIMPSKLSEKWIKGLGKDWSLIHGKYLDNLGNLTLLRKKNDKYKDKNSQMGNSTYKEKINILKQKPETNLFLNKDLIKDYDNNVKEWNENSIIKRGDKLISDILRIYSIDSD